MANWCFNVVKFQSEPQQLKELAQLFIQMKAKENEEQRGQLPAFSKEESGWLFNISWDDGMLYYETKWAPNTPVMVEIANHYNAELVHSYEEPGMHIYGLAAYKNGVLTDTFLDENDFALYGYSEHTGLYTFEGVAYESDSEILETLIERKLQTS